MFQFIPRNFSFNILLDEYKYAVLKKDFLLNDQELNAVKDPEKLNLGKDDIVGLYSNVIFLSEEKSSFPGDYDIEMIEAPMNFYKDYLLPAIDRLLSRYKAAFIKHITENNIYETTAIQNFSAIKLRALKNLKIQLRNCSHLNDEVKQRAYRVVDNLYVYISRDYYQQNIAIPEKISFKLSKIQVVLLFKLLHKNNLIAGHTDDLTRLIDRNFRFYDKSQEKYQDLEGAQRLYRKLINEEVSSEKALRELQSLFTAKDFFNILK